MSVIVMLAAEKLSWADFKKLKAPVDGLNAQTRVEMQPATIKTEHGPEGMRIVQLTLRVVLDSENTWVVTGKETAELLEHERLHYRIAIEVARELDTQLLALKGKNAGALQTGANKVMATIKRRVQTISDAYDKDTDHGRVREKQKAWVTRVGTWEAKHVISF